MTIIDDIEAAIASLISGLEAAISAEVTTLLGALPALIETAINTAITAALSTLSATLTVIQNTLASTFTTIQNLVSGLVDQITTLFNTIKDELVQIIEDAVTTLETFADEVQNELTFLKWGLVIVGIVMTFAILGILALVYMKKSVEAAEAENNRRTLDLLLAKQNSTIVVGEKS